MADDIQKEKLIALGAETLAEMLLDLSSRFDVVGEGVEQALLTEKEAEKQFLRRLSSLKRSTRFIHWKGSASFSRELEMLLLSIKRCISDPEIGLKLIERFFKTDQSILERSDDSSGNRDIVKSGVWTQFTKRRIWFI